MPPDRTTRLPPVPVDAAALLQCMAVAVVTLDDLSQPIWANEAARQALGWEPGRAFAALWSEPHAVALLCGTQGATAELQLAGAAGDRFRIHSQPMPAGGWVWTLQPLQELRASQAEVAHLEELLDLARDFGRLGVWERNVRTLEGRWDREVLRFWGMEANAATPDFSAAAQHIFDADRLTLSSYFSDSLKKAGRYSARYRVRALDGTVRRIHSQWLIKDGADGQPERLLGLMMDDSEPYALAQTPSELESQLTLAVELSGVAIWRHDLLTGRMHYSQQGWKALGLEPRPEGLSLDEVRSRIHPDDLVRVRASAEAALSSAHPIDLEARYRHADGSWRAQLLRRMVLRDDRGQPVAFLGVAMDVTERLEQQRRADELSRRFETVTRAAGIGHWLHEPGQASTLWSEQLRAIFGLGPEAPVPNLREWLDRFVHRDDVELLKKTVQNWLQDKTERVELAFRVLRADGQVRELLSYSQLESSSAGPLLFGVVIDITERRRSELALRSAEQRVALAARGAGLGTWELNLNSGEVHWDEQMWRLRGHQPRPQAMSQDELMACVHPEDRERAAELTERSLAAGEAFEHEFRVVWPDGQLRWLASRSVTIDEAEGGRRRRIGVNWDITDSRTAETVRQEREMALRESASKSKFLARMSHELRTPLNAVLGFSRLLLADETGKDPASASRRRRLDHIRSAGEHLLTLINDVLDLSGLEGGEVRIALQPVALAPLVQQTLPLLGPLQGKLEVRFELGNLDLHVMADATRLRQVLLNLLSNAVKYNRAGGTVRIDALRRGDTVLLRVADSGRGMSDEQLRQLFEPFNRLGADQEDIEGSGIGLAIVKALVERMEGSVHVDSQLGVGSVFELRLRAAADQPEPSLPARAQASPAARRTAAQRTVLYIEDNPVNALIIKELMSRRQDLVLQVAVDGASGVSQARQLLPELILLDMQLPDFDGYEVLRQLRQHPSTAGIPCIALSANAMPEDIARALKAGVSNYWTKPLDFTAFMDSLDSLFGRAA